MGNDTPEQRRPSPRIKARLVPFPREYRHAARCGRCGQFLWTVIDGDSGDPSWLNDQKRGFRFDPDGRIWRPTPTHQGQRRAAGDRVRAGTATDLDRVYLRFGGFGRGHSRPRESVGELGSPRRAPVFSGARFPGPGRFGATADLPVAVQCPRCLAENDLEDPVAQEA